MKKNIVGLSIATWLVRLAMRQQPSDCASVMVPFPAQITHGVAARDIFGEAV